MNVIYIFLIIVIDIIAMYLIKNCILWQIGPTCGFNAITHIINISEKINKKEVYFNLIKNAIDDELSEIGEIFSIQNCKIIIEKYTNLQCKVKTIKTETDILTELRAGRFVLIPYMKGKTPHWGVITASQGVDYVTFYDPELPTAYAESLKTLLVLNKAIPNTYNWKTFNGNIKNNKWYKLINKRLYLYLNNNYLNKEHDLKTSSVNLKNQVLVIK